MNATVLLDHVTAYAAAVRSHLGDLPPEQVDDLTDGLEADLAEALEDPLGPVATGEVPPRTVGGVTGHPQAASLMDLTLRFGPAAEYARELRTAAGIPPAVPGAAPVVGRAARVVARGGRLVGAVRRAARRATEPLRSSPFWQAVAGFVSTLRPVWWMVRGWVVFTLLLGGLMMASVSSATQRFVPEDVLGWVLLVVVVLGSVQAGRSAVRDGEWVRPALAFFNIIALVALPLALSQSRTMLEQRLGSSYPVYVETQVPVQMPPEDGVRVDGQLVSNLFVYDAQGNPLEDVQIFDDRGRQVRTTYDEGWSQWYLPGVDEPWSFAGVQDADGRTRWNVYPMTGAPFSQWDQDGDGKRVLTAGSALRTPPRPFPQAPALVTGTAGTAGGGEGSDAGRTTGGTVTNAALTTGDG